VRKGLLLALVSAFALLVGSGVAQAAPPANDDFAAASPLAVGDEISAANLDATVEPGEPDPTGFSTSPSCPNLGAGANCGTSVWYTFQPSSTGEYTIETCDGGTDLNTILGVYTGTAVGSLTQVGANDLVPGCAGGYGEDGSRVTFAATGGTVYRVDLTGNDADQGSFYLRAYSGAAQPRPQPETVIARRASVATALNTLGTGPGVVSGPRHSASFALESAAGAGFECSLDGAAFSACTPPISYDSLASGSSHVFRARAILGGAADPTPAIERFTIDATPPDTVLTSGPSGALASQSAVWDFSGSERYGPGSSACAIDSMPSFQCINTASFADLCLGTHGFRTAALDSAANADPTPASAQVNVTVGPTCAAPTVGEPTSLFTSETGAVVVVPFDNKGAGANLRIDYGPTSAYGLRVEEGLKPSTASATKLGIPYLKPNTTYHFRILIATPFGQVSTPDLTLTTKPPSATRPSVANGTPAVTGEHAVSIPVSIDPGGVDASYRVLIAAGGPVTAVEPSIFDPGKVVPGGGAGAQPVVIQLVDLEPATTYHYRVAAEQVSGASTETLGPEGTFTTPPYPLAVPILSQRALRFRLRRSQVKIGKLNRSSKKLSVRVIGLPAKTKVTLKLIVGKSKQTARKKAKANGSARFKPALSKRIRKALLDETVKKLKLKVTAVTPNGGSDSVTLAKKLKG
jgi:hypothetical protein